MFIHRQCLVFHLAKFKEIVFSLSIVRVKEISGRNELETIMSFIDVSHEGFEQFYMNCLAFLVEDYISANLIDEARRIVNYTCETIFESINLQHEY